LMRFDESNVWRKYAMFELSTRSMPRRLRRMSLRRRVVRCENSKRRPAPAKSWMELSLIAKSIA
jgi:hypothetical protein